MRLTGQWSPENVAKKTDFKNWDDFKRRARKDLHIPDDDKLDVSGQNLPTNEADYIETLRLVQHDRCLAEMVKSIKSDWKEMS